MSDYYVGEIRMFTRTVVPANWHLCDGTLLPIAGNDVLFSLLGTTYGGDGRTNFALPDLRGRVVMGQGTGPGLTPRTLGSAGGTETATVNSDQIPAHTHTVQATSAAGTTGDPTNMMWANTNSAVKQFSTAAPDTDMGQAALSQYGSGNSVPHNNMMPSLAINFIIALSGIYPPKS